MASGMWPSVSGASAQAHNVDVISNNLANVNTDGFKRDSGTFREYLTASERNYPIEGPSRLPIKDKDFYPLDGKDQSFVVVDGTTSDFRQGPIRITNRPLDVALKGKGLIEVSTPSGIRYTRHGSLKVTKDGLLVTTDGNPVLSRLAGGLANALPTSAAAQPGQGRQLTQGGVEAETVDAIARTIEVGRGGPNIHISDNGQIYDGDRRIATLSVVEFADPSKLRKEGSALYSNPDPDNVIRGSISTELHQGALEGSNVNPVREMTELIKAHRNFEQNLKAMRAYDQMMEKEANEVGKL